MKKTLAIFAITALAVAFVGPVDTGATGNGAPSGAHYNLNLIGVDKAKKPNLDGTSGHTIFVPLTGKCDIGLTVGDYSVLDRNCMDGDRAEFRLPDPDPEDDGGTLAYSVWIRPQGKPGGSATMTTCFSEFATTDDPAGTWCNAGELVVSLNRLAGGSKFVDVSKELLQVCADVDPTAGTDLELVPLFSDEGENYFWHYDNNGLRLAQVRFYPISTTAIGGDCTRTPHVAH